MRELATSIEIDASPEHVWDVLTDFDAYDEWNPFMRVVGRDNLGARLSVEIRPPGERRSRFRPTVTVVDRPRELRWVGHLFVPGIFDGEHRFTLEQLDGERTRFVQAESFDGVLAGVLLRALGGSVGAGFRRMNEALKVRAEAADPTADDAAAAA